MADLKKFTVWLLCLKAGEVLKVDQIVLRFKDGYRVQILRPF